MASQPSNDARLNAEVKSLTFALEVNDLLLQAVAAPEPLPALVARLASILHGSAVIYDSAGTVLANAGEAPTHLIANEVAASHAIDLEFRVGRWEVMSRSIALPEGLRTLAIASRGTETLAQIGPLLIDTAERMLSAVAGIQRGADIRLRRDNEQLIGSLQDGVLPSREHRYWSRMAQFKFAAYAPLLAAEAAAPTGLSVSETEASRFIDSARSSGIPLLLITRRIDLDTPATFNAIVPHTERALTWLRTVAQHFVIGVSAPFDALSQVPEAFRGAETALGIAQRRTRVRPHFEGLPPTELVRLDRVDLATWLLSSVDERQLNARVLRQLQAFQSTDSLQETLVTYFALDQQVPATARALFIHGNTVRYRLAKIEELFGEPITSASLITNLTLALQNEILGRRRELAEIDEVATLGT